MQGRPPDESATQLTSSDATRLRPADDGTVLRDTARSTQAPRGPAVDSAPSPGALVHDWYRLETLLGIGAMGQVWKALDLQRQKAGDPQPYVALKLLGEEFAQHERAMVALQREASKAQQLAHPNIATAYVFAEDPGTGQAYLAMELLEGRPLDRLIRDRPGGLERATALRIVRGLASGLAYAHAKGIVHCDFKPGNAFVTEAGVAKVLDFGIARLAQDVARRGDSFDAGEFHGLTPAYASLEMLEGNAEPHPADDVYALGLVAYEALTGRHPYGHLPADQAFAQGLRATPIKGIARREWRAIERAIRPRRAERWADAAAFLRALEGTSPWVRWLGVAVLVLAVVASYAGYQSYVASQPRVPFEQLSPEMQQQFRDAMAAGDRAYQAATQLLTGREALAAVYQDALGQYAAAYELHPRNAEADAALRRALEFVGDGLAGAEPEVRVEARNFLADLQRDHPSLARYAPLEKAIEAASD